MSDWNSYDKGVENAKGVMGCLFTLFVLIPIIFIALANLPLHYIIIGAIAVFVIIGIQENMPEKERNNA